MAIKKSGEDYLEAILVLSEKIGNVRAVDITRHLDITKGCVSKGLAALREDGFITVTDGIIRLTRIGQKKAANVLERHLLVKCLLTDILGVNEITANKDACLIEHDLSEETYLRLKSFLENK